jgi:exonuclease III
MSCQLDCASLSIASWNIHGDLHVKLQTAQLRDMIITEDILLIQETHLYQYQEETVSLPRGYSITALSRPMDPATSPASGGMAAIYRSSLQVEARHSLSSHDCLILFVNE